MKRLIPCFLGLFLICGCASMQVVKTQRVVVVENQTELPLALVRIRYGNTDIEFRNIARGKTRTYENPKIRATRSAVVQWASSKGTHFIKTVPVRSQMPTVYAGGAHFVLHDEYVVVKPSPPRP